jgi:hypothetical protein
MWARGTQAMTPEGTAVAPEGPAEAVTVVDGAWVVEPGEAMPVGE